MGEGEGGQQAGWVDCYFTHRRWTSYRDKDFWGKSGSRLQVSGRLAKEQKVLRRSVSDEHQEQQRATVFGGRGEMARTLM